MNRASDLAKTMVLYFVAAFVLIGACVEFFYIASGTGVAIGTFSLKWFFLFITFTLSSLSIFIGLVFWRQSRLSFLTNKMIVYRKNIKNVRWVIVFFVLVFPVWFLQYTQWGIVFHGYFIRFLIWGIALFTLSLLLGEDETDSHWKELLTALAFTSASFSVAVSLQGVTDYPFSLGWSEGNRLWDYSTLFGKSIYNFPEDRTIYVLLDTGRLWVGGLPFLVPNLSIEAARLWVGFTMIIPYFLVGIAVFRVARESHLVWVFITFWIFIFLKQGPIHAPLVLAAALTGLAWGRSLWISIPILIYAGYFAQASRFTWMFAPGIWIGVLELAGASLRNGKLGTSQWARAIALGIAGMFGGYLFPKLLVVYQRLKLSAVTDIGGEIVNSGINTEVIANAVSDQPLLWYRLLPNPTYGNGILIGLLIATLPLLVILFWLVFTKKWILNIWQKLALIGSLLAFLVVGLVASTKIGGGGDLHNMDMFLIGLAFTSIIAWYNGGREAILDSDQTSFWMKVIILMSLVIPSLGPLQQMRSFNYAEQAATLVVLADAPDENSLELLPSNEKVHKALEKIEDAVAVAKVEGEILFLDQRQLLTFGYVTDVALVPEYEKKVLMNEALSGNAEYFRPFYEDLARGRFSLIISERLFTPVKDSSFEFGEENNAWVNWVTNPLLCYYEEMSTLKEVGVQLLIPRENPVNCRLP